MKNQPRRKNSLRLKDYDYSQEGAYFVTLCAHQRLHLFGEIIDGEMKVNAWGAIVEEEWAKTAIVRPYVELDVFVIMPNHVHGIIMIVGDDKECTGNLANRPNVTLQPASLGSIIGQFKSVVTKRINRSNNPPDHPVWQRNYHDHIIRNLPDLNRIREYVQANPALWQADTFYESL